MQPEDIPDRIRTLLDDHTATSLEAEVARPSVTVIESFEHGGAQVQFALALTPTDWPDVRVAFIAFAPDARFQRSGFSYASILASLRWPTAQDQADEAIYLRTPPAWSHGMLGKYVKAINLPENLGYARSSGFLHDPDLRNGPRRDWTYLHAFPHRILVDGEDHHKAPQKLRVRNLFTRVSENLAPIMANMPNTVFVPLGPEAALAVRYAAQEAGVPSSRITFALPEHRKTRSEESNLFWYGRRPANDASIVNWDLQMPFMPNLNSSFGRKANMA